VNQLCEELEIPLQNPEISMMPNQQYGKKEKTSQYKGVFWHRKRGKWCVQLKLKGQLKCGGYFQDEIDAAKKVNQLCEELRIPLRNPEIGAISNQQSERHDCQIIPNPVIGSEILQTNNDVTKLNKRKREKEFKENDQKASQYKGVYWSKQIGKWYVLIFPKGQKPKYGGRFKDELEAAKGVNQLCEELGIPLKNPKISAIPNQQYQKKEKTSQFKGVTWHKKMNKWYAQVFLKRGQQKCGGYFKDELDAAKGVNQLCEELEIPLLNPEISMMPNQKYQNNCKILLDYDAVLQAELEELTNIFDENIDSVIKENLIAATNYKEQSIMPEINLQTKNGESALSIAAKYGFSNVVKFLISKGAEKEHFTNDHHTPLSLAVSQNHLKVVQILFENWISPNLHEKPNLHLSPIFQVKSREMAQILIDNDAVTHDIYNDKNQSPLTVACQNGYLDVVEFFLDDGLDINHLDCDNKTPLFYALTNNHEEVTKLLISKGAQN